MGGSLPIIMAYNSEFIQSKYRGPYLGVLSCFWMFGALLCGGIAWVLLPLELSVGHVRSWRMYLFASAFPSIIGALLFIIMPESPRFLLEVCMYTYRITGNVCVAKFLSFKFLRDLIFAQTEHAQYKMHML